MSVSWNNCDKPRVRLMIAARLCCSSGRLSRIGSVPRYWDTVRDVWRICSSGAMAEDIWVSLTDHDSRSELTRCRVCFPNDKDLPPETIMTKWKDITTFGEALACSLKSWLMQ